MSGAHAQCSYKQGCKLTDTVRVPKNIQQAGNHMHKLCERADLCKREDKKSTHKSLQTLTWEGWRLYKPQWGG